MSDSKSNQIKAVIFDLDDTLYPEKEYVKSGFHAVSEILNNVTDAEKKLWAAFENHQPAIDTVLKDEDIYSDELKNQCMQIYRFHKPDIHLYDGMEDMLIRLQDHGIKTGIITDGRPQGQRAKIECLGLDHLVNYIIITDDLGGIQFRKPNELAFRIMKEKLNVAYEEMVYVGDNPDKDFTAPVKLGMGAWWVKNQEGIYNHCNNQQIDKIQTFLSIGEFIKHCNSCGVENI